ncbi:MAG TPA: BlaI/MecI/CopY family transcriptional regulator [Longimicrobiaceae bacterium]|nr:BlaI/MecI/CopY family transcriptional regulator [Longimicrobiaceae bacterium]
MKDLSQMTDLQLEIMDVLWVRGEATVADVHDALVERTGLARKTIGTLLGRLEKQGMLAHRENGREFVYRATVPRSGVARATVDNVVSRVFRGDVAAMVSHVLEAGEVREGDVERIRELLARWSPGPKENP